VFGVVWIPGTEAEDHAKALRHFRGVGVAGALVPAGEIRQRYPALNLCQHALDLTGQQELA